jgi:hypothetical protein
MNVLKQKHLCIKLVKKTITAGGYNLVKVDIEVFRSSARCVRIVFNAC